MSERSGQPLLKTNAVLSSGLATAAAALLTSRFGMAGTLLGAALTSMIIIGGSAFGGFYMDRAAKKARHIPPKVVQEKLGKVGAGADGDSAVANSAGANSSGRSRPQPHRWLRDLFGRWSLLPRYSNARRRTVYAVLLGIRASFVIRLAIITSAEITASKSLSCRVWEQYPESVAATQTSYAHPLDDDTRPTIFGGGAGNDVANPPSYDGNAGDQYDPATR